jgi:hypothetical protein
MNMNASHWIWSGQAIGYTKISITAVIPNRAATLARMSRLTRTRVEAPSSSPAARYAAMSGGKREAWYSFRNNIRVEFRRLE